MALGLLSSTVLSCVPAPEGDDDLVVGTDDEAAASVTANGLNSINGLNSLNGLNSINGLNSLNGLNSINGLSSTEGLMTTAPGRQTVEYLVRCALPADRSITKTDQYGTEFTFHGAIGVAPEWEAEGCNTTCQEHVSACVLAHVNTTGRHVGLWLTGENPAIGWGRSTDYPYEEGSFFGNIFVSPPAALYCNGNDFEQGVVPGRLGVRRRGSPYRNPFGLGAYCRDRCATAPAPNEQDGYSRCEGYPVVTVWRNFDPGTEYIVQNRLSGKALDVDRGSTADHGRLIQWTYNGGAHQRWRIVQVAPGQYKFVNVKSGKVLDVSGGWTGDGAPLIQFSYTGAANQHWSFTPTGTGFYKFSPASNPNGSLDVKETSMNDGAIVHQWTWYGGPSQQWKITPAP